MIQTCNEDYWRGMEALKPEGAPCGRTFDDFDHLTVCPHEYFSGPSRAEIEAQQQRARDEGEAYRTQMLARLGTGTTTRTRTR